MRNNAPIDEPTPFLKPPRRLLGVLNNWLTDPKKAELMGRNAVQLMKKVGAMDVSQLEFWNKSLAMMTPVEREECLSTGMPFLRIGNAPPPFIQDPDLNDPNGIDGIDTGDERLDGIDHDADRYIP